MHGMIQFRVRVRVNLYAARIGPDQTGLALSNPASNGYPDSGRAVVLPHAKARVVVERRVPPVTRPAVVEKDRVTRLNAFLGHLLARERAAHIGHGHFET